MPIKDLKGKKFNRLTVLEMMPKTQRRTFWKCRCDCGNITVVRSDSLQSGRTKSCGCWKKEVDSKKAHLLHKHKMSDTRIYRTWQAMKARCYNPNDKRYKNYGGRGIVVCEQWRDDFRNFLEWALKNGYNNELTIDRINVNRNYEPSNCRWVNRKVQSNNRTSNITVKYNGNKLTLKQLSETIGLPYTTIYCRYRRGDRGKRLVRGYNTSDKRAKLTVEDVKNIKTMLKEGKLKQNEIASMYNITESNISCINTGKTWSDVKI